MRLRRTQRGAKGSVGSGSGYLSEKLSFEALRRVEEERWTEERPGGGLRLTDFEWDMGVVDNKENNMRLTTRGIQYQYHVNYGEQ